MLNSVYFGIWRVLSLAGVANEIKVESLEQRRQPDYLNEKGRLVRYKSLDWHIEWARYNSKKPRHLNSVTLLESLRDNPIHKAEPRYEAVVVQEPLHWCDDTARTVNGVSLPHHGFVITLSNDLFYTRMVTMHELGHVFGLFPGKDIKNPTNQELKEMHCPNECVMSWEVAVWKKVKDNPFCPSCLKELKQFFIAP